MSEDNTITVYTDGACSGNPGPGGYGAVLLWRGQEKHLQGYEAETTNNRMELLGAIVALETLKGEARQVALYTDSKYMKDGIERWIKNWKANDWRTANKQQVKNRDLWEKLDGLMKIHKVKFHWVKGHDGDYYNELADSLARQAIENNRL